MKKILIAAAAVLLLITGCKGSDKDEGGVVEISERLFVTQINDIYTNTSDYLGKTIQYEGIFAEYQDESNGNTYYSVIRYGPGCCGTDMNPGFEVKWDKEYPEAGDWVEAVGTLEKYNEGAHTYIRISLLSLKKLETRGQENVSQ
ncbi:MAG: hypothetical protein FWG30_09985 [Eubacteriaceae bacterium]|nr:hypothetical protein [Eubacteriaceae bacterium]